MFLPDPSPAYALENSALFELLALNNCALLVLLALDIILPYWR